MAREDLHFRLRIPEELKSRIEAFADLHGRSMTAEIIFRLQQSMNEESLGRLKDQQIEDLQRQVAELRGMNSSFANGIQVFANALAKAESGSPVTLSDVLKEISEAEPKHPEKRG